MKLRFALPALVALATPVDALDFDTMSAGERAAFRAEVRAYLLENPEVLQEAIGVLRLREQQAQAQLDMQLVQENAVAIFDDGSSFVGGNADGDITIVEFMDYRCGFCKRAFPEVEALIAADGNIRYIVKEYPVLGEQSELAARFAIATQIVAGDAAYKDVHNTLMEFDGEITPQSLTRVAEAFALDVSAITAELGSNAVTDIITANRRLAQKMNITGTPTFVFEDQLVRGYVSGPQMEELIASIRAE